MRHRSRSCHRVMTSMDYSEFMQLHDIVEYMTQCREGMLPATVSEAMRFAVRELHAALAKAGCISVKQET